MQKVTWVGLHMGVEISGLVANDYIRLVFVALVLQNVEETIKNPSLKGEMIRVYGEPQVSEKKKPKIYLCFVTQTISKLKLLQAESSQQQELEIVIFAQAQDSSGYPLGQSQHVTLQKCLMQNSDQIYSLSGHLLQQLDQLAMHMLWLLFIVLLSKCTATLVW